jgi:hypothetical protein
LSPSSTESFSSRSRSAVSSFWSWSIVWVDRCAAEPIALASNASPGAGFAARAHISVGEPVADVEQLAYRRQRIELVDDPVAVDRLVAELIDHPRLGKDGVAGSYLEARLVNEGTQVVLIR